MREDEMRTLTDVSEIRALYGQPMVLAIKKSLPRLDRHCRQFIRLSPFLLVSTPGPDGADISPRGDPSGFVSVEDDNTILVPDRPGNNRVDTLENILYNPRVGIIFLVPGLSESLRINGLADVVDGPRAAAPRACGSSPENGDPRADRGGLLSLR